jgi:DNA-binding CsgD family transcriptional regulator
VGRPFAVRREDNRVDPHYTQLYVDHYVTIDPTATAQTRATVDQPLTSTDMIDYDELVKTRAYQEWIKPQGIVDFINIVIEKSARSALMFGIFRHDRDGMVDQASRRRMQAIGPHIKRAALIESSFAARTDDNAVFADLLDGLGSALFLVRPSGQIVHMNAAGRAMLAAGSMAYAPGGRIAVRDPSANRALAAALTATEGGDDAVGRAAVAIPLSTDLTESHVAHVLSLTSGARRRSGHAYSATAAIFIRKVAADVGHLPDAIARHFRLTPSELRVLNAIVDSGGVPDVAAALGVSVPTVKTHLGNIYDKTGTGRHADLVKLIAGFTSPLAS